VCPYCGSTDLENEDHPEAELIKSQKEDRENSVYDEWSEY
jgi:sarcosine oxidase delta subunit